jgi:predicted nucleic acid-binding protein
MKFLDTNIIIRYLTRDDQAKAAACFALFQRLKQGTEEVTTIEAIITEVVYVLSSPAHYRLTHEQIRASLIPLLMVKGLKLPKKRIYLRALDVYAVHPNLDFEDALLVAHMEQQRSKEILSYDTDFDGISGITREEPKAA